MSPNHEGETGDGDVSSVEVVFDNLVYVTINGEYAGGGFFGSARRVEGFYRKGISLPGPTRLDIANAQTPWLEG